MFPFIYEGEGNSSISITYTAHKIIDTSHIPLWAKAVRVVLRITDLWITSLCTDSVNVKELKDTRIWWYLHEAQCWT